MSEEVRAVGRKWVVGVSEEVDMLESEIGKECEEVIRIENKEMKAVEWGSDCAVVNEKMIAVESEEMSMIKSKEVDIVDSESGKE